MPSEMSNQVFNVTQRMLNVDAFRWLKDFVQGVVMLETALDAIETVLKSDYDHEEWMALTFCLVMNPRCWRDIETEFAMGLGLGSCIPCFYPIYSGSKIVYQSYYTLPRTHSRRVVYN